MKQQFDIDSKTRRSPYKVPEGFFEQLERDVMSRIAEESTRVAPAVTPFYRRARVWCAAASIAIIAGVALAPIINNPDSVEAQQDMLTAQASNATDDGLQHIYNKLSDSDFEYLSQVYADDLFYQ